MEIKREQLCFEDMCLEERIIMNMYFRDFKYTEIYEFLGRSGKRYKGRYLREGHMIKWAVEAIIEEHKKDVDYF